MVQSTTAPWIPGPSESRKHRRWYYQWSCRFPTFRWCSHFSPGVQNTIAPWIPGPNPSGSREHKRIIKLWVFKHLHGVPRTVFPFLGEKAQCFYLGRGFEVSEPIQALGLQERESLKNRMTFIAEKVWFFYLRRGFEVPEPIQAVGLQARESLKNRMASFSRKSVMFLP